MREIVFDIETDGLLREVTKIHCVSYKDNEKIQTLTEAEEVRNLFRQEARFIGHNIIAYDFQVLYKLLGIKPPPLNRIVDTLPLSWTLYPNREKHGLEHWGDFFSVPKPIVKDWSNLSQEEYIHRCEEDVKINSLLWEKQKKLLQRLYT